MIYMGKNPRLQFPSREYQFAISQYAGKVGNQEVWKDNFVTKLLTSGLLALNLMGCIQTTDEVYSKLGESWTESKFESDISYYGIGTPVAGKYADFTNDATIYLTKDYLNFETSTALSAKMAEVGDTPVGIKGVFGYNNRCYAIGNTKLYYTEDWNTWKVESSVNVGSRISNGYWITGQKYIFRSDNKLYWCDNTNIWHNLNLPNFISDTVSTSLLFSNEKLIVLAQSCENMVAVNLEMETQTIENIFYGKGQVFQIDNSFFVFSANSLYEASLDFSTITLIANYELGSVWVDMVVFQNRIYFCNRSGSSEVLKYIEIANPSVIKETNAVIPWHVGGSRICISVSQDVLTFFDNQYYGSSVFVTKDGDNFVEVKSPNSEYRPWSIFPIQGLNCWVALYIDSNEIPKQHYSVSRGREAGSGITSESLNSNNNYVQFSNSFKM